MNDVASTSAPSASAAIGAPARAARRELFRATVLELQRDEDRRTVDDLADRVRRQFAADLAARPSRHVYVSSLSPELRELVDRLRSHPLIRDAIGAQLGEGMELVPLVETDELYLCHHNHDWGGDHGLFAKHYDGNLRSVPFGVVVRALIYLSSSGAYEVVFEDSDVSHAFRTYEVGLLDFHRELHWVRGEYEPGTERFLLKCNYLAVPAGQKALVRPLVGLNLGQFYVVKAAMEYSKSPRTVPQRLVGLLCNAVRLLNNVHPLLPHVLFVSIAGVLLGGIGLGLHALFG